MAVENLGKTITFPANTDLSTAQYKIVLVNSSGNVAVCGDGARGHGILQNDPAAAGREALVAVNGLSKVVLGGTATAGSAWASDSSGRAVDAVSGDYVIGTGYEGGTVAGTIGSMIVHPEGKL